MAPKRKVVCDAVIWVARDRVRPFYRSGALLPFLGQHPYLTALTTIEELVRGRIVIASDYVLPHEGCEVGATKIRCVPSRAPLKALARGALRLLRADRILIVDASAPFINADSLRQLVPAGTRSGIDAVAGNGAALCVTREVFAWLAGTEVSRPAQSLDELFRLMADVRPCGATLVEVGLPGAHENPLLGEADIYNAVQRHRLNTVLRLARRGLGLRDPGRIDLRGKLSFGRNTYLDANVIIIGDVHLGNNVTVGPNCILEDARVKSGSTIREFSTISGSTVGEKCRIGPYARIRPRSIFGRGCQIGNFVEVKSSKLGPNCKINHHSFVGDATIGKNVIIGAGSITCNFDGEKSNATVVRDGAFIGSGVMLVAPLTVGSKAFVAAGSTLVSNAPANSLTIGRARQISLKGWTRNRKPTSS